MPAATNAAVGALRQRAVQEAAQWATDLGRSIAAALARYTSERRLYALDIVGYAGTELLVEAFAGRDGLDADPDANQLEVLALCTDARLPLKPLLGRPATLSIRLADGTRSQRSGLITEAEYLDSDGGFARYRLTLGSWPWLLARQSHYRAWQGKTVLEIVSGVFADPAYAQYAAWSQAPELAAYLADIPPRDYCVQHGESDWAFVARLLTEEGIGCCIVHDPVDADSPSPAGHSLHLFADSAGLPVDTGAAMQGGAVRFHRADAQESADAVQRLIAQRSLAADRYTVLQYIEAGKQAISGEALAAGFDRDPADARSTGAGSGADPRNARSADANSGSTRSRQRLDSYQGHAPRHVATRTLAERHARLWSESVAARRNLLIATGTLRSLVPGTTLGIAGAPGAAGRATAAGEPRFAVVEVRAIGRNDLPSEGRAGLDALLGDPLKALRPDSARSRTAPASASAAASTSPWALQSSSGSRPSALDALAAEQLPALIAQVQKTGYACTAKLLPIDLPYRPLLAAAAAVDAASPAGGAKPRTPVSQTAIVCGPGGATQPAGGEELYCDAENRIRVRFHWQELAAGSGSDGSSPDSCWIRVASRQAGPGTGMHFLPRIGQEVMVGFLDGDIEKPVVLGALYGGKGERAGYGQSQNRSPAAQGNRTGGNAPAWHGDSPDSAGHRNAAALSGFKSQEFGGLGASQLIFDDSPGQLRVLYATSAAMSQLQLGALIHQADDYRGSCTGAGFALTTQAYGTVRANQGLLLSSYRLTVNDRGRMTLPAGDFAAGQALLAQARQLGKAFSEGSVTHLSAPLAAHVGVGGGGGTQKQSSLDAKAAPLQATAASAQGMVDGRSGSPSSAGTNSSTSSTSSATSNSSTGSTSTGPTIPHFSDPLLALHAKSDQVHIAGQDLLVAAGETLTQMSGQDTHLSTGSALRIHAGQNLGIVAGLVAKKGGGGGTGSTGSAGSSGAGSSTAPGSTDPVDASGLSLIAGKGPVTVQAQSDSLTLASLKDLKIISSNANLDFAAAKKIVLKVEGGASLTIENGSITFACPGTITVKAGKKEMLGGGSVSYPLPAFPSGVCLSCLLNAAASGAPFAAR